jgi:hypothetical protein
MESAWIVAMHAACMDRACETQHLWATAQQGLHRLIRYLRHAVQPSCSTWVSAGLTRRGPVICRPHRSTTDVRAQLSIAVE